MRLLATAVYGPSHQKPSRLLEKAAACSAAAERDRHFKPKAFDRAAMGEDG